MMSGKVFKIYLKNEVHLRQLRAYLDIINEIGCGNLTHTWNQLKENARLYVSNDAVMLPCTIKGEKNFVKLGFNENYLANFGLSSQENYQWSRQKSLYSKISRLLGRKSSWFRAFEKIWDKTEGAVSTDYIKKHECFVTWEKLKVYNYLNEIYPLIKESFAIEKELIRYIEIGAGSCGLIALLKKFLPKTQFVVVDLPTTIPFGFCHLAFLFPKSKILLPTELSDQKTFMDKSVNADFIFLSPNQIDILPDNFFHMGCNTDSFCEMMPDIVKKYFRFLRKCLKEKNIFFCHNRAEKVMFDSSHNINDKRTYKFGNPNVIDGALHMRFGDYPWLSNDKDYFFYASKFYKSRFNYTFFTRATQLAKAEVK